LQQNIGGGGGDGDDGEPGGDKSLMGHQKLPHELVQRALSDLQEKLKAQFALQRQLAEEKEGLEAAAARLEDEANQLRSQLRDMTVALPPPLFPVVSFALCFGL
jgi:hypothetical protein